ncbi:hypothetical protein C8R45DRAFT_591052 [Mycena sanguinolenta]|nr:hypothetical protein C8R45DRAFT_591052 [Mycena sanguinolenta]
MACSSTRGNRLNSNSVFPSRSRPKSPSPLPVLSNRCHQQVPQESTPTCVARLRTQRLFLTGNLPLMEPANWASPLTAVSTCAPALLYSTAISVFAHDRLAAATDDDDALGSTGCDTATHRSAQMRYIIRRNRAAGERTRANGSAYLSSESRACNQQYIATHLRRDSLHTFNDASNFLIPSDRSVGRP